MDRLALGAILRDLTVGVSSLPAIFNLKERQVRLMHRISLRHNMSYGSRHFRFIGLIQIQNASTVKMSIPQ